MFMWIRIFVYLIWKYENEEILLVFFFVRSQPFIHSFYCRKNFYIVLKLLIDLTKWLSIKGLLYLSFTFNVNNIACNRPSLNFSQEGMLKIFCYF